MSVLTILLMRELKILLLLMLYLVFYEFHMSCSRTIGTTEDSKLYDESLKLAKQNVAMSVKIKSLYE